jgi:hypothetical protein
MATGTVHGTHIQKQYGTTAADRVDFVTDTLKVMLVQSAGAVDVDAHDYISDVNANEASATGYTAGGATLGTKSVTLTGASNKVVLDCADPSWTLTTTIAFRYAVVYKDTGSAATSVILCSIDFGAQSLSGVLTIQVDADGIMKGTY